MIRCRTMRAIDIQPLVAPHLRQGFLETLAALSEVELTPDQAVGVLQRRLRAGIQTFVAVQEGRVVGTASLIVEPKFLHGGSCVGHIEDVVVHPDCQGQGIGQILMRHCEQVAREHGCYKLILDCSPDRRSFYEKLGYHEREIQMRKNLPAA